MKLIDRRRCSPTSLFGDNFSPQFQESILIYYDAEYRAGYLFLDDLLTVPITNTSPTPLAVRNRAKNNHNAIGPTFAQTLRWEEGVFNGRPVLRFDGTDDFLEVAHHSDLSIANGEGFTIMFVLNLIDASIDSAIVAKTAATTRADSSPSANGWDIHYNGNGLKETILNLRDSDTNLAQCFIPTDIAGSTRIVSFVVDWSDSILAYLDGGAPVDAASIAAFTGGLSNTNVLRLGFFCNDTGPLNGDLGAFLLIKKVVTNEEHDRLGRFFASRYGLTWSAVS